MSQAKPDLSVVAEIMPSSGGAYASELTNSVQSSKVNNIEMLFREAVQNSHDQRVSPQITVNFQIKISKLSPNEGKVVLKAIQGVKNSQNFRILQDIIEGPSPLYLLTFSDASTKGLNGPTDASVASEDKNFVNFFHKVGRDSQSDSDAGGSFGHGRAVFFNSSKVSTALVYTRFSADAKIKSRFYGMTLGENFSSDGREYTGKWLWGNPGEGKANPLTGAEADTAARFFGIYDGLQGETGTSISILAPRYIENDKDAARYADTIAYAAEKSIWPHLMKDQNGFTSISVQIIPPASPILSPNVENEGSKSNKYVKLYREAAAKQSGVKKKSITTSASVSMERNGKSFYLYPGEILGVLSWTRRMLFTSKNEEEDSERTTELVGLLEEFPPLQGVAIFRTPKLVVDYIKPPFAQIGFEIVGFFEASQRANPFLRAAEPDTHDSWSHSKLQGILGKGAINPVKRILSQIDDDLKTLLPKQEVSERSMEVALMNDLGAFLSFEGKGVVGPGKPTSGRGGAGGGGSGSSTDRVIKVTPLSMSGEYGGFAGDKVTGHFRYEITRNARLENGKSYVITFVPRIALKDGYEEISDESQENSPRVVNIIKSNGTKVDNPYISRPGDDAQVLNVVIETPRNLNAALQFSLNVEI